MSEQAFSRAYERGAALGLTEIVGYALSERPESEAAVPEQQPSAARPRASCSPAVRSTSLNSSPRDAPTCRSPTDW